MLLAKDSNKNYNYYEDLDKNQQDEYNIVLKANKGDKLALEYIISLNKPIYDEESDRTLLDIIATSIVTDPEELIISKEELKNIENKMNELLSDLELEVLELYLSGKSYQYIANMLNRDVKSIDNALQRVKRKLEKHLENRNN